MKKSIILTGFIFVIFVIPSWAYVFELPGDTITFQSPKDSVEYELIIFDPEFDIWFFKNSRPMDYFNQAYLESWNAQLAMQWNSGSSTGRYSRCAPTTYLDYDRGIDYGKELNYKLFYYFMFMQDRCRIFSHAPRGWR